MAAADDGGPGLDHYQLLGVARGAPREEIAQAWPLRIYEREGLLDPVRSAGGTRRYSRRDIDRLAEIENPGPVPLSVHKSCNPGNKDYRKLGLMAETPRGGRPGTGPPATRARQADTAHARKGDE